MVFVCCFEGLLFTFTSLTLCIPPVGGGLGREGWLLWTASVGQWEDGRRCVEAGRSELGCLFPGSLLAGVQTFG